MATKKTQKNVLKNAFWLRVYDNDVLISIHELYDTKTFDSMNELLNKAVAIGIEKIYREYGKKKALSPGINSLNLTQQSDELLKKVKSVELTIDDLFVMMSMIETLITSVYNIEIAKTKGEMISTELIESGYFGTLPENLQNVKNAIIRRVEQKKEKRKE